MESKRRWFLWGLLALIATGVSMLCPKYRVNEFVYVLDPLLAHDPDLLKSDFFARAGLQSKWVYNHLLATPVGLLGPLPIALLGRLIAQVAVTLTLARLCRTLGLQSWQFFLFFVIWFYGGQRWMAGEWVLDGMESKPFSYALIFLALDLLIHKRTLLAAALAGAATSLHVLSGGWAVVAMTVAVAANDGPRPAIRFNLVALAAALPGLVPALVYGSQTMTPMEQQLMVRSTAQHMDPATWFTLPKALYFFACWACAAWLLHRRRLLTVFIAAAGGIFCLGLLARQLEYYWFLVYYPFRLADAVLPVFFLASAVHFLGSHRFRPVAWIPLVLVLAFVWEGGLPARPVRDAKRSAHCWYRFTSEGSLDPFAGAAAWIQANTAPDTVFIVPPDLWQFWLQARRPTIVSTKRQPHNQLVTEWHRRLRRLVGEQGFEAYKITQAGRAHYESLSRKDLQGVASEYGAEYYVTTRPRPDLEEVYRDEKFCIYAAPVSSGGRK